MTGVLLAIDTATSRAILALGQPDDGRPLVLSDWPAGHAHAETLLPRLSDLLTEADVKLDAVVGVVVGIGPGGFTGLRIGLATAKTLAHGLRQPIVGISSAAALAAASGIDGPATVILPAGPRDRYLVAVADLETRAVAAPDARLVAPAALEAWLADAAASDVDGATIVAVDVDDAMIPVAARERGAAALGRLGAALLQLGAAALAAGRTDDAATLVPAYVSLPRGIADASVEAAWSPALR
jgi:tRNA threonylcarbamoyladenosine biosynthesis protein TsaB